MARPLCVVELGDPVTHTWETRDGILKGGKVTLNEGKVASSASVMLVDPNMDVSRTLPLPYRSDRTPISIWMGLRPSPEKVFSGVIANWSVTEHTCTLMAVDKAKGMRRIPRSRTISNTNVLSVVQDAAATGGLSLDVRGAPDLAQFTYSQMVQHAESDMDLAQRLLASTGHTLMVRGDTLLVRQVGSFRDSSPFEVEFGEQISAYSFKVPEITRRNTPNLLDLDGEVLYDDPFLDTDVVRRLSALEASGVTVASGDLPSFNSQRVEQVAARQAAAKKVIEGSVVLSRIPDGRIVDTDDQLVLRGFGRFTGVWNIESVSYELDSGKATFTIYNGGIS